MFFICACNGLKAIDLSKITLDLTTDEMFLRAPHVQAALSSNGCYYLGILIDRECSLATPNQALIRQFFTIIAATMRASAKTTGRQLASRYRSFLLIDIIRLQDIC